MTEPIKVFESQEQLDACLKEWQERLFLSDWIIKPSLCEPDDMKMSNVLGENESFHASKVCYIRLRHPDYCKKDIAEDAETFCQEKVLVHELLHCKYDVVIGDGDCTYEQVTVELHEHQLLEQMSKSLIMAKYNLTFDWFKNL